MRSSHFHIIYFLLSLPICGCQSSEKKENSKPKPTAADSQILSQSDIENLTNTKKEYDDSVDKVFIFIEAETRLTDGGESFIRDYADLFKNNLGSNYKIYLLTDASQKNSLFKDFEHAAKGKIESPIGGEIKYARRGVTEESIQHLIERIQADFPTHRDRMTSKKVQMIFHFLAHGISLKGMGDGSVSLSGEQQFSWRQLAEKILQPLASSSDELIAIIESCFGGNVVGHLPNDYFVSNNVMLILGAPPWVSQLAPVGEGVSANEIPVELSKDFRSSVATMAIRAALMGYASEGYTESFVSDPEFPKPTDEVRFNGKTVEIFKSKKPLLEKQVVRVNEFIPYVEKKGQEIYCRFLTKERTDIIRRICDSHSLSGVKFDISPGIISEHTDVVQKILVWIKLGKSVFVDKMRKYFEIPQVHIFTSNGQTDSLNPRAPLPDGNGILSLVNLSLFESGAYSQSSKASFLSLKERGLAGVDDSIKECMEGLDSINEDLFDAIDGVTRVSSASGSNPSDSYSYSSSYSSPDICKKYPN